MDPSAPQEVREDRLKRYRWMHLLGWLFLAAIALIAQWIGPAFFEHLRWLIDWMAPGASLGWKIGLGKVVLLIGPLAAGAIAQFIIQSGQGRSKADALQQMQKKLFSEIEPGDQPGYQVALVDTPNASVRSLGVVTSTFEESATGRRLATVYLPNTPDPTKGAMRVVAMQDISALGWTLDDLTTLHITFGSVTPETCCPPPPISPSIPLYSEGLALW